MAFLVNSSVGYYALIAVRILAILIAITGTAVGLAMPLMQNTYNPTGLYVTFWKRDTFYKISPTGNYDATYNEFDKFIPLAVGFNTCEAVREKMRAGAALTIIALVFQLGMLIASVLEVTSGNSVLNKKVFYFLHLVSVVFGVTSWAMAIDMLRGDWCAGFIPKNNGYVMGPGVKLYIAAWVIQTALVTAVKALSDFVCGPSVAKEESSDDDKAPA